MSKRPSLAESMKALSEPTAPDPIALVSREAPVTPQAEPTRTTGKRYEGFKKMLIPVDPEVHRKLRMIGLQRDMTLERVVQEAVAEYVLKRG
jgi:predicted HicB family RNase H-like nuclease